MGFRAVELAIVDWTMKRKVNRENYHHLSLIESCGGVNKLKSVWQSVQDSQCRENVVIIIISSPITVITSIHPACLHVVKNSK